jgi:hypothetical protein
MSTVVKVSSADFSRGPGFHTDPFVGSTDLLFGWDFRDWDNWKTGVVAGHLITGKDVSTGAEVAGELQFSQSLDGLGLNVGKYALARTNVSVAQFSNNSGDGRTFMCMVGADRGFGGGAGTYALPMSLSWQASSNGLALIVQKGTNFDSIAAPVEIATAQMTRPKSDRCNLMFLTANANSTWTFHVPNLRYSVTKTNAELSAAEPIVMLVGVNPASLFFGNVSPGVITSECEFQLYQIAGWDRKLTNAEINEQYQRCRLRFPGVLL